jgi:hypothetical protein
MAAEQNRKSAVAAAKADDGTFEVTDTGWRRVSRVPKEILAVWRLFS